MTEERYNEIDNMDEGALNELSEEEYRAYDKLRYLKLSNQKKALEDLRAHIETAQQGYLDVWPTGFKKFDEKLDGGFLGGNLIMLGAISSLGKTSFAMQIAEQLAAQDKDVLIFSLEMSKNELNAKIISRNTYKLTDNDEDAAVRARQKYRLTTSDILRGRVGRIGDDQRILFDEAFDQLAKLNDHLYIIRDNNMDVVKVAQAVRSHIDATNNRPFVILDYLQILKAPEDARTSDKRLLTDSDVNNLKDMAEKLGVPILAISSFNRNNYLEPASMGSFKESGSIEYSCDVLIALQYSGMQYQKHWCTNEDGSKKIVYESQKEHDSRVRQLVEKMDEDGAKGLFLPIDVILLKNRGAIKGKTFFSFCPKYNVFLEDKDQKSKENVPFESKKSFGGKSLGRV